jgi:hypothetical protein
LDLSSRLLAQPNGPLEILTNLKMNLADVDEKQGARDFYGKVIEAKGENGEAHVVGFTSVPP